MCNIGNNIFEKFMLKNLHEFDEREVSKKNSAFYFYSIYFSFFKTDTQTSVALNCDEYVKILTLKKKQ